MIAIGLVLFVSLASAWSAPKRAQAANEMRAAYAMGLTAADYCGDVAGGHDHCPLCRLLDEAPETKPALALADLPVLAPRATRVGATVAEGIRIPGSNRQRAPPAFG